MPSADPRMHAEPRSTAFRADIQGLRAVAVGLVVLAHAQVPGLAGGFVGVDVFFVLSGFLITGLLLAEAAGGGVSLRRFYARRARRILPAATVVIVATGFAATLVWNFYRAREVLVDCLWAGAFAANIHFAREGTDYFSDSAVSPLLHFWSLAVEEQFYLVWPALLSVLVLGAGWRRRRTAGRSRGLPRARLAAALGLLATASVVWSALATHDDPTRAYFSPLTRAYELLAGALIATCLPWLRRVPRVVQGALAWIGVGGIVAAALLFTDATPFPGTAALLPVLATCAVLVGGLGGPRWGAHRMLAVAPMRGLGDISYSLYLWHWPLLILGPDLFGLAPGPATSALLVSLAVVVSIASYALIETPLRKPWPWGHGSMRALLLWPVSLTLVVAMVFVGWPSTPAQGAADGTSASSAPAGPAEVRGSVRSAQRGDPLPQPLFPGLDALAADETKIGECSGYHGTQSKLCEFGDPQGTRTVVLFGNSHAVAWLPAVAILAKQAGWRFVPLVKEACDYPGYVVPGVVPQCHAWYQWATAQLAQIQPDLIVMNGYAVDDGWQGPLTQAATDLKQLAARTVMLSDVPYSAPGRPIDCLAAAGATMRTCTFAEVPVAAARDRVQTGIAASVGIPFVDVSDWFCADGMCPLVVGDRIVYASIGHLSATYSAHLAPILGEQLGLA